MKKPVIGITAGTTVHDDPVFFGCSSDYVHDEYVAAVHRAGGVPILLPITGDRAVVQAQLELCDGVVLTGGNDLSPLLYGQEPHQNLTAVSDRRDRFDMYVCKLALQAELPILGICRGCQILNVICGGTLHQDLPSLSTSFVQHMQPSHPTQASHTVSVDSQSVLAPILGETALVNSLHHQAIDRVAEGFLTAATAKDGVVEAIERQGGSFALGGAVPPGDALRHPGGHAGDLPAADGSLRRRGTGLGGAKFFAPFLAFPLYCGGSCAIIAEDGCPPGGGRCSLLPLCRGVRGGKTGDRERPGPKKGSAGAALMGRAAEAV